LKSTNGISDITIAGNDNKLDIEQFDASGAIGHNLKKVITGNTNSIITQQQGTNDTTVDIRTAGDNNTVTVRTTSASTVTNPRTAVAR
jgi:phage tail sheath gpL-like